MIVITLLVECDKSFDNFNEMANTIFHTNSIVVDGVDIELIGHANVCIRHEYHMCVYVTWAGKIASTECVMY